VVGVAEDLETSWGTVILIVITSSSNVPTSTPIASAKLATTTRGGAKLSRLGISWSDIHIQTSALLQWRWSGIC
jgi:hypothetical protein